VSDLVLIGILNNLMAFKSVGSPGIKHIRIAGVRQWNGQGVQRIAVLAE
jgi:hypothetical protein